MTITPAIRTSGSRLLKTLVIAAAAMATLPAWANQNTVLEKFENAAANWNTPQIEARLVDTANAPVDAAALGNTVVLSVSSSEPSSLLLAIVNTYGDVRLVKSADASGTLTHEFEAKAPVGQYAVFTFATSPELPNNTIGMPEGVTSYQLPIGVNNVDTLLAQLQGAMATHQIAKGTEYSFLVDDASLAMRGIRKRMKSMKAKKTGTVAAVTAAVKDTAAIVTKKEAPAVTPVAVEPAPTPTVVVETQPVEVELTAEPTVVAQTETTVTETVTVVEETATAANDAVTETTSNAEVVTVVETDSTVPLKTEQEEIVVAALNTQVTQIDTAAEASQVQLTEVQSTELTPVPTAQDDDLASDTLSLDIKFALNSDELTQSGVNALDTLGSALLSFQRAGDLPTIMLEGHTDDTGSEAYNLVLSEKRANSARKYLLERFSLPTDSIMSAGFGETSPKVLEQTREGRRANRRVELRVIN